MKVKQINSFEIGDKINGFFLCTEKYFKNTRLGDSFIDLIVSDSTGMIRCKIWRNVDFYNKKFDVGFPVAIKGNIINFNNKKEIDINHISSIKNNEYDIYGFKKKLIVKSVNSSSMKMWKIIESNINSTSSNYNKFLKKIYSEFKNRIIEMPSFESKYKMQGGYIHKLINILKINDKLIQLYDYLDKDKVIIGILFKEIGCIEYFNDDLVFSVSDKGKLLNIQTLGIGFVNTQINKSSILSEEEELFLKHIISVKGSSPDLEAEYVNILFNLDLKLD